MRLEFSFIGAIEWTCYAIIMGFFLRTLAAVLVARNSNSSIGQALAFIF